MSKKKDRILLLHDPKTASSIIGSFKRSFSRSPMVREFLNQHRIEKPYIKKDGSTSKVPRIFYPCFECKELFPSTQINVDHINPVIPTNIPIRHMSLDIVFERAYCDIKNLQILCKNHHSIKSEKENKERTEWLSKTKYIVYQTVNRANSKKYIGVHKCVNYDDAYLGSGVDLKEDLRKYGTENFYRVILFVFDNQKEALEKERELVDTVGIESGNYYNLIPGGAGHMNGFGDGIKEVVICHQTKEEFDSISELSYYLKLHPSTVSRIIDNENKSVNNLHYFKKKTYNPNVTVSYPMVGRSVVCLNNKIKYNSVKEAAESLGIGYKSLRNALCDKDKYGVRSILDWGFVYADEYENKDYYYEKSVMRCVELDKYFNGGREAAEFLKIKNPQTAAISINGAARLGKKLYKYHWERTIQVCVY